MVRRRMKILTRDEVRKIDERAIRDFAIPGIVLMENAGRGITDWICQLGVQGPIEVCCGQGNNGGDGFVIARQLDARGFAVRIHCCVSPSALEGDARINYEIARNANLEIEPVEPTSASLSQLETYLSQADWIVDAMLGTGATGPLRSPIKEVVAIANRVHGPRKMAVDLPSGLNCDTGHASDPTFRATHTCTLVAAKPGLFHDVAQKVVGQLHVVDIGLPRACLNAPAGR